MSASVCEADRKCVDQIMHSWLCLICMWACLESSLALNSWQREIDNRLKNMNTHKNDSQLIPVVLVPPLTGSEFICQVSNNIPVSFCAGLKPLFISPQEIWPPTPQLEILEGLYFQCYCYLMELVYDEADDTYANHSDVSVYPNRTLESVTHVNGSFTAVGYTLQALNYTFHRNVFAAPYDWRLGPNQWMQQGGEFERLQRIIEGIVTKTGQKPILISTSMGGPYLALFFQRFVTSAWKAANVDSMISISGPFGGNANALQSIVSPTIGWSSHTVPAALSADFLLMTQTFGSVAWSITPNITEYKDLVLLSVINRDGTVDEYDATDVGMALRRAGANITAVMWEKAQGYADLTQPLGVPSYIMYGDELDTPISFTYKVNFSDKPIEVTNTTGDGLASTFSLWGVPSVWLRKDPNISVSGFRFPGMSHSECIFSPVVMEALAYILIEQ